MILYPNQIIKSYCSKRIYANVNDELTVIAFNEPVYIVELKGVRFPVHKYKVGLEPVIIVVPELPKPFDLFNQL